MSYGSTIEMPQKIIPKAHAEAIKITKEIMEILAWNHDVTLKPSIAIIDLDNTSTVPARISFEVKGIDKNNAANSMKKFISNDPDLNAGLIIDSPNKSYTDKARSSGVITLNLTKIPHLDESKFNALKNRAENYIPQSRKMGIC